MNVNNNGRRSTVQIIGDILRVEESTKTEIMYSLGFNSGRAKKYIGFLLGLGFLETVTNGRKTTYKVTTNGKELLGKIDELVECLGGWDDNH